MPPTRFSLAPTRRGPGLRPSSGKRRLRCHALGHHPAAMGGALAAPSRETPGNEMLMRRE